MSDDVGHTRWRTARAGARACASKIVSPERLLSRSEDHKKTESGIEGAGLEGCGRWGAIKGAARRREPSTLQAHPSAARPLNVPNTAGSGPSGELLRGATLDSGENTHSSG